MNVYLVVEFGIERIDGEEYETSIGVTEVFDSEEKAKKYVEEMEDIDDMFGPHDNLFIGYEYDIQKCRVI